MSILWVLIFNLVDAVDPATAALVGTGITQRIAAAAKVTSTLRKTFNAGKLSVIAAPAFILVLK